MSTIHLAPAVSAAMLTVLADKIDYGSAGGTLKLYSGAMPATTATAIGTQVHLGTVTYADPCGTVTSDTLVSTLTASGLAAEDAALASGVAAWARIADSDGGVIADIDVSSTGGSGVLQLNTTNIVVNGPIAITAFSFTL